jgi:F0F1-type ATP synthase assembly protein I
MLSRLILLILIGSIGLVSGLFLSLSLAFYISQVTHSPYLGFLIVALCYLVIVGFLFLTKDSEGFQQKFNTFLKKFIFDSPQRKNSNE